MAPGRPRDQDRCHRDAGEDGRPPAAGLAGTGARLGAGPGTIQPALQCGEMIYVSGQVSADASGTVLDPDALVPSDSHRHGEDPDPAGRLRPLAGRVVKVNAFFKSGGTRRS